jgi:hypothetical protein
MNSQKGNVLVIIPSLIVVIALASASYFFLQNQKLQKSSDFAQDTSPPPTPITRDETENWKTYTGRYFSFEYPLEAILNEQGSEMQSQEVSVTYIKSGANKPNTDLSDGYIFSVTYGSFIGTGPIEETINKFRSQIKEACSNPIISTNRSVIVGNIPALSYDVTNCMSGYTQTVVVNNSRAFLIYQTQPNDNLQHDYRQITNQILGTFRFL